MGEAKPAAAEQYVATTVLQGGPVGSTERVVYAPGDVVDLAALGASEPEQRDTLLRNGALLPEAVWRLQNAGAAAERLQAKAQSDAAERLGEVPDGTDTEAAMRVVLDRMKEQAANEVRRRGRVRPGGGR